MPGLVPGIHVFNSLKFGSKAWMAGTSPAMTEIWRTTIQPFQLQI